MPRCVVEGKEMCTIDIGLWRRDDESSITAQVLEDTNSVFAFGKVCSERLWVWPYLYKVGRR